MSWSWVTKIIEKKVTDEVSKQLNVQISKDGKIEFKPHKKCRFCKALIPKEEIFCPKCKKSLE